MRFAFKLAISFLLVSALTACDKEEVNPDPVKQTIAPCTLNETFYDIDSVYYGPSLLNPHSKYNVKFMDTANNGSISGFVEYSFNKIPTSGIYKMVHDIDSNDISLPNQIAYVSDSGSFLIRSKHEELSEIYIEKSADQIVISWCSLPDTTFYFDMINQNYVGNFPYKFKTRKHF